MRLLGFFILIIGITSSALANAFFVIGGAADLMFERGMDLSIGSQSYTEVLALYGPHKSLYVGGEYFNQSSSPFTGQQTYSIKRQRRGGFTEIIVTAADWGMFNPYFTAGVGGFQDLVTTVFMSSTTEDTSRFYLAGFGGLGLKLDGAEPVYLALEARLIFGENLDPTPTASTRLILGFKF